MLLFKVPSLHNEQIGGVTLCFKKNRFCAVMGGYLGSLLVSTLLGRCIQDKLEFSVKRRCCFFFS